MLIKRIIYAFGQCKHAASITFVANERRNAEYRLRPVPTVFLLIRRPDTLSENFTRENLGRGITLNPLRNAHIYYKCEKYLVIY